MFIEGKTPPIVLEDCEKVMRYIQETPYAIGYISLAHEQSNELKNIKKLTIKN